MSEQLDLLLINPGNRKQTYQTLGQSLTAVEPPVWAGLMATFARGRGLRVEILDAEAEQLTPAEAAARVAERTPTLAAMVVYGHQPSASTQNMTSAGNICRAIKDHSPGQNLLLLGGHVASLPERTLREEAADFVAGGEGLWTLVELTEALKTPVPALENVRGLWWTDGEGELRTNPGAPLVRELDELMPTMAWDLLPMHLYRAHNWHCFGHLQREPYAAIYTTLGCPFHCSFCCIQAPFKSGENLIGLKESVNSYRFWSVEKVLEQIDVLVNRYGVRNIKIADEMFVLNQRHVIGICDGIIERGYDLNIWAYTRVDTLKDEMLDKLKRAGINWLAFGIEAASARVRDDVQKGFGQDEILQVIRKTQDAGINIIGNYIFGLPEDDHETMQMTLDMALELNCEFANFYCTMAYPGSSLYGMALKENWSLPETWAGFSQHAYDTLPLRTKYLSAGEVIRFRDNAFQTYFTNPNYLGMIERKFGADTVEHIRHMTSHQLERKFTP